METQYRYIYLDDEEDDTTKAIADGLRDIQHTIDVSMKIPHKDFGKLRDWLKRERKNYHGIICMSSLSK